eukprot:CAMPEP_0181416252 /NCGR_PEP_ID=MMETSP1110-20121109/10427_1 /TAXON_ID=174948 /ORGANISM="Symbiodinium sp., Strain CCMP421" /LENGTH=83 /DNA_ID=CAMNT_0023539161 /DNA_START=454 /DNA_END=702 /DNA_ORIENTATION=+
MADRAQMRSGPFQSSSQPPVLCSACEASSLSTAAAAVRRSPGSDNKGMGIVALESSVPAAASRGVSRSSAASSAHGPRSGSIA